MHLSRPAVRTAAAITALSLSFLATACSSSNNAESSSSTSSSSAAATSAEAGASTAGGAAPATPSAAATIPDGYQSVTASQSGISFAVPDSWKVSSADELKNPDDETLQMMADALGVSPDQARQTLQQTQYDLYLQGDHETANVVLSNLSSLPSQSDLTTTASSMGATPGDYATKTTPLGEAATMTYTLDAQGTTLHAAMIFVKSSNGTYPAITIGSESQERTATLTDAVLNSLS